MSSAGGWAGPREARGAGAGREVGARSSFMATPRPRTFLPGATQS
jgi:hypothetical protein